MAEGAPPDFNLPDLIDLALCSPEVGAVNFNILRIFLHELLRKFGYDQEPAQLNDLEANQIQNFKNYIQGAGTASPMPGVLRYATGHQFAARTPRTAKSSSRLSSITIPHLEVKGGQAAAGQPAAAPAKGASGASGPNSPKGFVGDTNQKISSGPKGAQMGPNPQPLTGRDTAAGAGGAGRSELEAKVARLERHLEALYALPTNQQILGDKDHAQGMSVNDMWQIIQLNNRVAAAEAAIQKMASLIEDLAREMKSVKSDAFSSRKESLKVDPIAEKCAEMCRAAQSAVDALKHDLDNMKQQWKSEIGQLQTATGVDIAKTPSFMKLAEAGQGPSSGGQGTDQGTGRNQNQGQQPGLQAHGAKSHTGVPGTGASQHPAQGQGQQGRPGQTTTTTTASNQPGAPGSSARTYPVGTGNTVQTTNQQGVAGTSASRTIVRNEGGGQGVPQKLLPKQQAGVGQAQTQGPASAQQAKAGAGHAGAGQGGQGVGQVTQAGASAGQAVVGAQVHQTGQGGVIQAGTSQPGQAAQGQGGHFAQVPPGLAGQGPGFVPGAYTEFDGQLPVLNEDGTLRSRVAEDGAGSSQPDIVLLEAQGQDQDKAQGEGQGTNAAGAVQEATKAVTHHHEHGHEHGHRQDQKHPTSDSHPEARHHHHGVVPVDVTNVPLTGVIHQDHVKPFHDYKGAGSGVCSEPPPRPPKVVPVDNDLQGFIPAYVPLSTDPAGPYAVVDPCAGQADLVQKELQLQYSKLQGMQRQMAQEIQEKMEFVYQKLLREIEAQHLTTSPYMAVGANVDKCLGPGVCAGHGMPADTAVCQFPQAPPETYTVPCAGPGHTVSIEQPVKPCADKAAQAAPGVCPGVEVCPACKGDILHHLRQPPATGKLVEVGLEKPGERPNILGQSASDENLIRKNISLVMLPRDLEELRAKVKVQGHIPDVFDEIDVLEKLATLWEAVNVLKSNEESIAVRLLKQDVLLKKVPAGVMEQLQKIPVKNLEAIASSNLEDLAMTGSRSSLKRGGSLRLENLTGLMNKSVNGDDLQMIFNNLRTLVVENSAVKERLEKFNESIRDLEDLMVTRPMLVDAMSDKADKGQMNTKVSYDEFGASMDEITNKLQSLLLEVYQKNENWKNITEKMAEELAEKLDKAEIGPLRAYFKSHLQQLQEKVIHLTKLIDEPDPAGTRKKLLKDYNCISCDRHTAISGVTNCPTLPLFGPILAGHTTASTRAFELHRMRTPCTKYDSEGRDFNLMEKQNKAEYTGRSPGSSCVTPRRSTINDADVMNLVNRYVGGSHTAVTNADRVAAMHKRPVTVKEYPTHIVAEEIEGEQDDLPGPPQPEFRPKTVANPSRRVFEYEEYDEFEAEPQQE